MFPLRNIGFLVTSAAALQAQTLDWESCGFSFTNTSQNLRAQIGLAAR